MTNKEILQIALHEKLAEFEYKVCFMAEYFLPDVEMLKELPCDYEIKVLTPEDFARYYTDTWSNALCKKRKHPDVLLEYRRKGIASAVTSRLKGALLLCRMV